MKTKKQTSKIIIAALIALNSFMFSQTPFSFSKKVGGFGNENISKMRMDALGNSYVVGWFESTVDFDPGVGVANLTSIGGADIFFAKYDANGNYLWAKQIGTSSDDYGRDLKLDASNNVHICGDFAYGMQSADFDPGAGVAMLTTRGNIDAFFAKYDLNGNYIWAKNVASQNNDHGACLSVDALGNVYFGVMGSTVGIDYDPGPGVANIAISAPWNFVIAKYTSAGNFVWAKPLQTYSTWHWMTDFENDAAGNLYAVGYYSGTTDFDGGTGVANRTPVGGYDACLLKYDPAGNFVWVKTAGGSQDDFGQALAIDNTQNLIFWTGSFKGTSNFNVGSVGTSSTSVGNSDIFMSKFDLNGNYILSKTTGGSDDDVATDIRIDGCPVSDRLWITGYTKSPTINLEPLPGISNFTNHGGYDAFYGKYCYKFCYRGEGGVYGGTLDDFSTSIDYAIIGSSSNRIKVLKMANAFQGTAFSPLTVTSSGQDDAYILIRNIPLPTPTVTPPIVRDSAVCSGKKLKLLVPLTPGIPATGCDAGVAPDTLGVLWYASALGGPLLGVGHLYTQILTNTTSFPTTIVFYAGLPGLPACPCVPHPAIPPSTLVPVTVTIYPTPNISVNSASICMGNPAILTASNTITYLPTNYSWNTGFNGNPLVVSPSINTTYSVIGTINNVFVSSYNTSGPIISCSNTAASNVIVLPSPTVNISGNASICSGQSTTLTASGANTYSWSNGSVSNPIIVNPSANTTYTVIGTNTLTGCSNSAVYSITITPSPIMVVNPNQSICVGQSLNISVTGANTYTWSNGSNQNNFNYSPTTNTILVVHGANLSSCSISATIVINVNPLPIVTIQVAKSTVCENEVVKFIANGGNTYLWFGPNNFGAVISSPILNNATISNSGTYTVTATSVNGCSSATTIAIMVNPNPTISILKAKASGCAPLCNTFTAQSNASNNIIAWTIINQNVPNNSNSAILNKCFDKAGVYYIKSQVKANNGCTAMDSTKIEVYLKPIANFSFNPENPSIYNPLVNFSETSTGANVTSWIWDFKSDGSQTSTSQNPNFSFVDMGKYLTTLIVQTENGCSDSISKIITVEDETALYVPNAFTPNGDGNNDMFSPKGSVVNKYLLQIYDRWGAVILESKDFNTGWNGTFKNAGGDVMKNDVYNYKISYVNKAGKSKQLLGTITLVN